MNSTTSKIPDFENLKQLKSMAEAHVSKSAYDYVAGGAGDEKTLESNRNAYDQWKIVHRVLRDVSKRQTSTQVLKNNIDFPVMVAPTAFHCLMHEKGESATAQGASRANTLMVVSTLATQSLEDIAQATSAPKWFQLYIYKDRDLTESLVERAEKAGYEALVLTVDSPVWGKRERDIRNGFSLPDDLALANFSNLEQEDLPAADSGVNGLAEYVSQQLDPSLTWSDVKWLKSLTDLPLLIKGIVHPEDAQHAMESGCEGIIVSNHGGRQLDAGISTLQALPQIVDTVGDEMDVFVDGGIRRGTDVFIALALGAQAVLIGRPVLWSLAIGGAQGVTKALNLLKNEFDNAMALSGTKQVEKINFDQIRKV